MCLHSIDFDFTDLSNHFIAHAFDKAANKTYVCHNGNTICVNIASLQSHLNHGDFAGPCGPCNIYAMQTFPNEASPIEGKSFQTANVGIPTTNVESDIAMEITASEQIQIFPNPASTEIHLVLQEGNKEGIVRILSLTGQEIQLLPMSGQHSINIDLSSYATGLYLVDVRSVNGHFQRKIVKL